MALHEARTHATLHRPVFTLQLLFFIFLFSFLEYQL